MRKNLPVTGNEYVLRNGLSIVSKTDLKGRITYVNPYFIEASGFAEDELIGAPHNLVRHPDMPPEAFQDLWNTLKAGIPWTGVVKNRRKNGDHYWVMANVTPILEGGQTVGYMSVRTRPAREQVDAAAALYRAMQEGQARGLAIRRGNVVRSGMAGMFQRWRSMAFSRKLAFKLSVMCMLLAAIGIAGMAAGKEAGGGLIAGLAMMAMVLTLALWHWLHMAIVRPVGTAIKTARALAGGDLSASFDTGHRDDIGELLGALQQMNVNLQAIVGDVRANIDNIAGSAKEIAAGNLGLSGRTEAQAANLEETASSMEELASTIRQNAEQAAQAHQVGVSASDVAAKGGEIVKQVVETMGDISASSNKVVDIIGLIDGIAFQTNLLALNAAVEAARAGEQGRGFAVVAGEVRSLAQRCTGAAAEIKRLIDIANRKVGEGTTLVHQAGATMEQVVTSVRNVTATIEEISTASAEQRSGIDQISEAVTHLDSATQQNAALVEEAAAAASSLSDQATQLAQSISVFRLAGHRGQQ